jgi:hypothetical protein
MKPWGPGNTCPARRVRGARLEGEFPCQAARVLRGAHDSRLHLNLGAAMRQLPSRTGKHPLIPGEPRSPDRQDKQPERVEQHARPRDHADVSTAAPIADELLSASAGRVRLCVLCGGPLRAGQHMIRVHGSTIHARCSTAKAGSG